MLRTNCSRSEALKNPGGSVALDQASPPSFVWLTHFDFTPPDWTVSEAFSRIQASVMQIRWLWGPFRAAGPGRPRVPLPRVLQVQVSQAHVLFFSSPVHGSIHMKLKTGYLCTLTRYRTNYFLAVSFVFLLLFFKFQLKRFLTQLNLIVFIWVEIRHVWWKRQSGVD